MNPTAAPRASTSAGRKSRRRYRPTPPSSKPLDPTSCVVGIRSLHASGQRGALWFRLQRHQGGLYVEREEHPHRGMPRVQSVHFRHARDFDRWCDHDPVRFEHPLLHVDLKRGAAELWQQGDRMSGDT